MITRTKDALSSELTFINWKIQEIEDSEGLFFYCNLCHNVPLLQFDLVALYVDIRTLYPTNIFMVTPQGGPRLYLSDLFEKTLLVSCCMYNCKLGYIYIYFFAWWSTLFQDEIKEWLHMTWYYVMIYFRYWYKLFFSFPSNCN
jgi:hypothetical protein